MNIYLVDKIFEEAKKTPYNSGTSLKLGEKYRVVKLYDIITRVEMGGDDGIHKMEENEC
jgi:hypothetical protein